jgi:hypothetical protein
VGKNYFLNHLQSFARSMMRISSVFTRDVGRGLWEVSHSTLALLGLLIVSGLIFIAQRDDVRNRYEIRIFGWLQERHQSRLEPIDLLALELSEPEAISRTTALNPKELSRTQQSIAQWLSRRYSVAPEPIGRLVQEAWYVGGKAGVDPTLILAMMAIESSFNPFAQSPVGAQGLMQVMTKIHQDKYQKFGGELAAFDPVTNLRVGVQVLKECISRGGGSVEEGLRFYVGAALLPHDEGYINKVLAEQNHIKQVANGKQVALNVALPYNVRPNNNLGPTAAAVSKPNPSLTPVVTPAAAPSAPTIVNEPKPQPVDQVARL